MSQCKPDRWQLLSLSLFSQFLFSLEGQSHGAVGLYPHPPRAPATPGGLGILGQAGLGPFLPFFLHHSCFRLKLHSQGLLKSPQAATFPGEEIGSV